MSDTPRTDKMLRWIDDSPFDTSEKCFNALAFFARTLERELAKAKRNKRIKGLATNEIGGDEK